MCTNLAIVWGPHIVDASVDVCPLGSWRTPLNRNDIGWRKWFDESEPDWGSTTTRVPTHMDPFPPISNITYPTNFGLMGGLHISRTI